MRLEVILQIYIYIYKIKKIKNKKNKKRKKRKEKKSYLGKTVSLFKDMLTFLNAIVVIDSKKFIF